MKKKKKKARTLFRKEREGKRCQNFFSRPERKNTELRTSKKKRKFLKTPTDHSTRKSRLTGKELQRWNHARRCFEGNLRRASGAGI